MYMQVVRDMYTFGWQLQIFGETSIFFMASTAI